MIKWLLVLPASIAAYLGVCLVIGILNLFGPSWPTWWTLIVVAGVAGYAFVVAGSNVAPAHHLIVAVTLTAIHAAFAGFSVFYQNFTKAPTLLIAVLQAVVGVGGTVAACHEVAKEKGPSST